LSPRRDDLVLLDVNRLTPSFGNRARYGIRPFRSGSSTSARAFTKKGFHFVGLLKLGLRGRAFVMSGFLPEAD